MSRAKTGNCASNIAPKNQNHEFANIAVKTSRFFAAKRKLRPISTNGLRPMITLVSAAGVTGMARLTNHPNIATNKVDNIINCMPLGCSVTNTAPLNCPVSMPTNVPICTMPFPPTSSCCARC